MTKKKRNEELQRREFMKTVATGGVLLDVGQQLTASDEKPARKKPEQKTAAQPGLKRNASRITFPRSFTGRNLPMIAFPLGGIGTGTISLGGRGQLRDREILNRMPDIFEAYRLTIVRSPYLLVEGPLQKYEGVIHVQARKIEAISLSAASSHDFK